MWVVMLFLLEEVPLPESRRQVRELKGGGGLCRQFLNYQELGKMFHCLCHL